MNDSPLEAGPDERDVVEVTASLWRALLTHLLAWAIGAGGFAVLFPPLRWFGSEEFANLPATPLFILQMALMLHVVLPVILVFWFWYRLHRWRFSERGVECLRLGRRVWLLEWERIAHVWLAPLSVVLYTDAGTYYLTFVDREAVRGAIPPEKLKTG